MIVEYIVYKLTEHDAQSLVTAYTDASQYLSAAPECKGYELARCLEDEKSFISRIHWISVEAHMDGFRKGPHFAPFLNAILPFIPEITEMRHYQPTDIASGVLAQI